MPRRDSLRQEVLPKAVQKSTGAPKNYTLLSAVFLERKRRVHFLFQRHNVGIIIRDLNVVENKILSGA